MSAPAKTVLGRVLASVRAMRQLAASDVAALAGVGLGVVQTIETGRRTADGEMLRRIASAVDATADERMRIADAMASLAIGGGSTLYDMAPTCHRGHRVAAILSIESAALSSETWNRIAALVAEDLVVRSEAMGAAA